MKNSSKTIVFFGSGPVAAASLKALSKHLSVEAVVTKPVTAKEMDQAAPGVSQKLVSNKHELTELMAEKPFKSSVGVIVDFGIIVEQAVIDYFPLGIVNSHFSLLPEWRGADPITFAILSGQNRTGVSLMLIVAALDEGPLLAQSQLMIGPTTTTPELTEQLIDLSNSMLVEILPLYMDGKLQLYEQSKDVKPTYSRKLTKEDGKIDWHKSAIELERQVRAFSGWPGSIAELAGKQVIITKSHVEEIHGQAGKVTLQDKKLLVGCESNSLAIDELKPVGKNTMSGWAFVAGHKAKLLS